MSLQLQKSTPFDPVPGQFIPMLKPTPNICKIHFNIILPSMLSLEGGAFPWEFLIKIVYAFLACLMFMNHTELHIP
jgi:hypothetical protein